MNLYVHEEIFISNPSPFAAKGYTITVNNIELAPHLIMIDRTNSSKNNVHLMLTKPSVLDIAQKIVEEENSSNNQNMTKEMTFTLSPQNVVNSGSNDRL